MPTEDAHKNVVLNVRGGHYGQIFGGNNTSGTIWGNVTVNIYGGTIHEVFGGSNLGGDIKGQIIVNIDSTDTGCELNLDYVYGGGNEVAYAPSFDGVAAVSPEVNILQGTVNQTVFGGSKGTIEHDARVTARPTVYVGDEQNLKVRVGNGSAGELMGMVFGGGNVAPVTGNTKVVVRGSKTNIYNNVYGGGNGTTAIVTGSTDVTVGALPTGYTPTNVAAITATVDQDARTVQLSSATQGAVIRYTLDGTDPLVSSHQGYTEPIVVTGGNTLRAVATRPGYNSTSEYTITSVATPTISVDGSGNVTITCATDGATIYYTTDGSEPTTSSSDYITTISGLPAATTVKAIAVKASMINSSTASHTL